jgi:hypothetical protein
MDLTRHETADLLEQAELLLRLLNSQFKVL